MRLPARRQEPRPQRYRLQPEKQIRSWACRPGVETLGVFAFQRPYSTRQQDPIPGAWKKRVLGAADVGGVQFPQAILAAGLPHHAGGLGQPNMMILHWAGGRLSSYSLLGRGGFYGRCTLGGCMAARARSLQIGINDELYRPLVEQVFDYWKHVLDHPRSRLDAAKFRAIVTQFELGYELEDLLIAIEGVACDTWPERRSHDGVEIIFRSANMDKFLTLGEESRQWRAQQIERRQAMQAQQEKAKEAPTRMPEDTKAFLAQYRKTLTATR